MVPFESLYAVLMLIQRSWWFTHMQFTYVAHDYQHISRWWTSYAHVPDRSRATALSQHWASAPSGLEWFLHSAAICKPPTQSDITTSLSIVSKDILANHMMLHTTLEPSVHAYETIVAYTSTCSSFNISLRDSLWTCDMISPRSYAWTMIRSCHMNFFWIVVILQATFSLLENWYMYPCFWAGKRNTATCLHTNLWPHRRFVQSGCGDGA
jgi:hypothetical protein